MQGSVWSSLKCTTMMDSLNKLVMSNQHLQYYYKKDTSIPIGVRGMVDDTIGISECGNTAVQLNAVINSFIETQRLTLSKDKSSVVHIGSRLKCKTQCPKLKVHQTEMLEANSVKYLGNIVTSTGGVTATIEDRRNKGWGKVATILGILKEVDMGSRRVQVGLLLRKAILINSLLFTAETWSGVKEKELRRLEQVDQHLLRSLLLCHSKTAVESLHLESGTLKLRHVLTMNRMMYHHHILSLNEEETVKKIYNKQKETVKKGDWYDLLMKDFKFVGKEINEKEITVMSKQQYKKIVQDLVEKAALKYLLAEKESHSKLAELNYKKLTVQPYLIERRFSKEERKLLVLLRSRCFNAKDNFKKLWQGQLQCRLGCLDNEDQHHIFTQCIWLNPSTDIVYENIFKAANEQKEVIEVFIQK
jgi:hypothetical protein